MTIVCSSRVKCDQSYHFVVNVNVLIAVKLLVNSFWGLVFFIKIITSNFIVILSHCVLCTICACLYTVEFIVD